MCSEKTKSSFKQYDTFICRFAILGVTRIDRLRSVKVRFDQVFVAAGGHDVKAARRNFARTKHGCVARVGGSAAGRGQRWVQTRPSEWASNALFRIGDNLSGSLSQSLLTLLFLLLKEAR